MKRIITALLFLLLCLPAQAQPNCDVEQHTERVEFLFGFNSDAVEPEYRDNRESLNRLTELVEKIKSDSMMTISKVDIDSYSSPEGDRAYNNKLSVKRADAIYDYVVNKLSIPDSIITKRSQGIDWEGLKGLVLKSDMSYKVEVVNIIDRVPEETWRRVKPTDRWMTLVDSRNKHLMDLKYGRPYMYMFENIYPLLRRGSIVTVYFKTIAPPVIVVDEFAQKPETQVEPQSETLAPQPVEAKLVEQPAEQPQEQPAAKSAPVVKPLFAVKTNLLFDAVSLINAEIEVPIKDRWSVAAEWVFPWWSSPERESSKRNTMQLLNGNIEGKYWFGDRAERPVMTGWFAGLYAGGGLYDMGFREKGYQGEFFIALGLSGGYAHTINRSGSLRMEYSLGLGYLQTDYEKYVEHYGIENVWHSVREGTGTYKWFGPTKAKVSLVWLLSRTKK